MRIFSHPLPLQALQWSSAIGEPPALPLLQWCETRDVLRARIDSLTVRLLKQGIEEDHVRLLDAVLSEIGSNSFDHNIGQWRDVSGVLFDTAKIEGGLLCALADRGQGVWTTLRRVRPDLTSDLEALHVAFTERLSGRAPEKRGNGLKFVRSVLIEDGIDLWYGSGTSAYVVEQRSEKWLTTDTEIFGCCAILFLHIP